MMHDMMGWMGLAGLIALLALLALVAAAVYLGVRAARSNPRRAPLEADSARALLDRRLAAGEIGPEDYYEREAVLRTSPPSSRRRRRRPRR